LIPAKQTRLVRAMAMRNSLAEGEDRDDVLEVMTVTVGPLLTVTVTMLLMPESSDVGAGVAVTVAGPVKLQ
jgi:hypothetical protein